MLRTDVVIVGSGLAGSIVAAMLGQTGYGVIVADPHVVYPPDFRCEKLDGSQMRILERTGLADAVRRASTPDQESWVARRGVVIEKRSGDQQGILYDELVNTIRTEIPQGVTLRHAKVIEVVNGGDSQTVKLSTGEEISARLVVVANGLNIGLRQKLGIERDVLSPNHSTSIGFDIAPLGGHAFAFSSLTYFADRPSEQLAYLTLFPIGPRMRANLFGYRDLSDPWLKQLRDAPLETICAAMPGLRSVTGDFRVVGSVKIRPADLYVSCGYEIPGVVLVGDAFSTSCPAAGTGTLKAFTDVERLCNLHIPRWLATPGMGVSKIREFYSDPVKVACETHSLAKAYDLRSISVGTGLPYAIQRWAKFAGQFSRGTLRQARVQMFRVSGRGDNKTGTSA